MDRLFDTVLVRPPSMAYKNCVSSNPEKNQIDPRLAAEQHSTYLTILKEYGVEVLKLPVLDRYPDSVFLQDPALVGMKRCIIGRFGETSRRGEENELLVDIERIRHQMVIHRIEAPGSLEGGDILVTEKTLFVGESSRSNANGITQLSGFLPECTVATVRTKLFHLLCGCSYLTNKTMIITPDLISTDNFRGFKFVKFAKSDAYASDALYLGEGRVVIPSGYPNASRKLRNSGFMPVEVDVSEFRKGDGGVTCLCSPIYKFL
jgi:dimethylargininase